MDFSVIVATYNSAKTLRRCLDSIVSQTGCSFEILVADGESNDETVPILKSYSNSISHWVSEADRGVYEAWNKVIPKATGQWLYFIGSDDWLSRSDALALALNELTYVPPDINLAYGKISVVSKDGAVIYQEGEPWENYRFRFTHEMVIPHQATFHRRGLFSDGQLFSPDFRICGDFEIILREIVNKRNPVFLGNISIASMQVGGMSSTRENVPVILRELRTARMRNGLSSYSYRIFWREVRFRFRNFIETIFGVNFANTMADWYRVLIGKERYWTRRDL